MRISIHFKLLNVLAIVFAAWILNATTARAQEGEITVATRVLPPFVIKDGSNYTGFSAMLWQSVAQDAGIKYRWLEVENVREIMNAVAAGKAQAGIAAISITSEREDAFDFSQPMFESGLQIMVSARNDGSFDFWNIIRALSTGALPAMLSLLAGLVLIPAHVVWLAERKHETPLFARTYIPGIFHAIWWATGATAGQQPDIPRSGLGRLLSGISILVSVIFMAFFTASLTASITVGQLQGQIGAVSDLVGKKVATTTGSTSAKYLVSRDIPAIEVGKIEDAFRMLTENKIDAVVFDAPVLNYYAATEGSGKVKVVGQIFKRENYGILLPRDSELRKRISASILKMREDGSYDTLYNRWFSSQAPVN